MPIWATIVGVVAFLAALGMLVWAGIDLAHGKGVSEVVIDVFIAIVLGGIGASALGLWRGGRGPREPAIRSGRNSPGDGKPPSDPGS